MAPFRHQVTDSTTGVTTWCTSAVGAMPFVKAARPLLVPVASSTRWIHCTAATQEATNDAATAAIPHQAALRPARLPKSRMTAKETAGSDGTSQAFWSTVPSALQLVDFVEVGTAQ